MHPLTYYYCYYYYYENVVLYACNASTKHYYHKGECLYDVLFACEKIKLFDYTEDNDVQ